MLIFIDVALIWIFVPFLLLFRIELFYGLVEMINRLLEVLFCAWIMYEEGSSNLSCRLWNCNGERRVGGRIVVQNSGLEF